MIAARIGTVALLLALLSSPFGAAAQEELDVAGLGVRHGSADAPVQIVEFSDLSCPWCATFHLSTRDSLFTAYVRTGKARWTSLPYVTGQYPNSMVATTAAACAGSAERYEVLVRALYDQRSEWVSASSRDAARVVRSLAAEAGIGGEAFERCRGADSTRVRIRRTSELAREVGVRGTPTYLIDGFPAMGALPYGYVRRLLDRLLTTPQ